MVYVGEEAVGCEIEGEEEVKGRNMGLLDGEV